MLLHFTKMHGLGNDFMVVDLISQRARFKPEQVKQLADRHFGIGFDQLLLVEAPTEPDADFRYRIYNADGSEVENCGNGARCFARFVRDKKLTIKREIRVQTAGGPLLLHALDDQRVTVNMGAPRLQPSEIPFHANEKATTYPLIVDGQHYDIGAVSMGNPHAVLAVEAVDQAPVTALGPKIEHHPDFPQGVNVGFLEVISRTEGRLRVFERGSGETLACGTGACAAMVSGVLRNWFDTTVTLHLRGGTLEIEWAGPGHPVMMTGPAVRVFDGQILI
ncbi:diaminopimelate epimerase [Terasakiispira papahanaumokuakeensis]|uniref:Diaminopimelate epimerase n=1 Tax=Terasakiispira papahanaumokuakeensis TaxID=197479 RepID=A0A1E2VD79_9GAMM|nr:diaminopimelate epimerase [Terasakiispira papahanaumokuakeensis]ODC04931.1 diaminopimelate epimerase [Terasakiispira papahanaumokuakeensis]